VLEETGFDISELLNHDEFLECRINEQISRLYIVPGVPLNTKFQAKTRNEIKVKLLPFSVEDAHVVVVVVVVSFWRSRLILGHPFTISAETYLPEKLIS